MTTFKKKASSFAKADARLTTGALANAKINEIDHQPSFKPATLAKAMLYF